MTKIYLVVFENEKEEIFDAEVFTNKKKAEQYSRYWNAKCKLDPNFKDCKTRISIKYIKNTDYTKYANELEKELLPY